MTNVLPVHLVHLQRHLDPQLELSQKDLRSAHRQTRQSFDDLALLLPEGKAPAASPVGMRSLLLVADQRERTHAAKRLGARWESKWSLDFDPQVRDAVGRSADEAGKELRPQKRALLQTGIFEALLESLRPQITQINRDRTWRTDRRLVLLQKKELQHGTLRQRAQELLQQDRSRLAGLSSLPFSPELPARKVHSVWSFPQVVIPAELRPSLFVHWVRRRAIRRTEERALRDVGIDRFLTADDWDEVTNRNSERDENQELGDRHEVSELEILEALDRNDPDPLEAMIAVEERDRKLRQATPTEKEVVEDVSKKVAEGLTEREAKKAVAKDRDVKRNTIHKTLSRFDD